MKKKISFVGMSFVLLIVILLAGCAPAATPEPAQTTEKLNIGVASGITGTAAFIGGHMKNGIMMAIDDRNAIGGVTIAGKKYLLNPIVRDTKCDPIVGKTVVEELIDMYNTKFIAGLFAVESFSIQPVIEQNKVITYFMAPFTPAFADTKNIFSYFSIGAVQQPIAAQFAFLQKYYPKVKTVAGVSTEGIELAMSKVYTEKYAPEYGFTWLGVEKFPASTTDFMPIIQKVLALKPEAIDTMTSLNDVQTGMLLLKQLREAGFKGPVLARANPEDKIVLEVIGKEGAEGLIDVGVNADSSIVLPSYKEMAQKYEKKYNTTYADIVGPYYTTTSAFFDFLNTQDTLDTTQWTEAFVKYKWTGVFGDTYWGGKPAYLNSRVCIRPLYLSEWHDGKRDTKFSFLAPKEIAGY